MLALVSAAAVALLAVMGVAAAQITDANVTVLMNDTRISYYQNGNPVDFSTYITMNNRNQFSDDCDSYVELWDNNDAASLMFNGTLVQINFLRNVYGGPAVVLIDGTPVSNLSTYGQHDALTIQCEIFPVIIKEIPDGEHNLTVVNEGFKTFDSRVMIQNFIYTPSDFIDDHDVPTLAFGQSHTPSKAGLIAGIVCSVVGGLVLIGWAAFFIVRRRRRAATPALPVAVSLADLKTSAATINGRGFDARSIRTQSVASFDADKKDPLDHQF